MYVITRIFFNYDKVLCTRSLSFLFTKYLYKRIIKIFFLLLYKITSVICYNFSGISKYVCQSKVKNLMTLNFSAREPKARSIMYLMVSVLNGIMHLIPLCNKWRIPFKIQWNICKRMRISNSALNLSPGKKSLSYSFKNQSEKIHYFNFTF